MDNWSREREESTKIGEKTSTYLLPGTWSLLHVRKAPPFIRSDVCLMRPPSQPSPFKTGIDCRTVRIELLDVPFCPVLMTRYGTSTLPRAVFHVSNWLLIFSLSSGWVKCLLVSCCVLVDHINWLYLTSTSWCLMINYAILSLLAIYESCKCMLVEPDQTLMKWAW